jgi:hypothetical protein
MPFVGIELGFGYKVPNKDTRATIYKGYNTTPDYNRMPWIGFSEGYYASFSVKKYFAASRTSYLSFGAFYRNWNYQNKVIYSGVEEERSPYNYFVKGSSNINIWGFKALIGKQLFPVTGCKFILDGFIGLGIRYKAVDMHNEYFHPTYGNGPNIDVPYEFKKELWRLSIQAGLKIGLGW